MARETTETPIYQASFIKYVLKVQRKHKHHLRKNQIRFLTYPFITSVFWAKQKNREVKKENINLFYQTIFKQLAINF